MILPIDSEEDNGLTQEQIIE